MIYENAEALIGKTPLVEISRLAADEGCVARVLVKIEGKNPFGSAKDRIAKRMLDMAERDGKIKPGSVIIEPTSGNTGIALAALCAVRGYRAIIVMPDTMSGERIKLMEAYGAEVVLTPGAEGMSGSIKRAKELCDEIDGAFIPSQFDNPANPLAHYETTGPEIFEDTDGEVDIFVGGVGTGGTVSGVGEYLKGKKKEIQIVGVEPRDSAILSGGVPGPHKLQGIGAGFVPEILNRGILDEVIPVTTEDAYATARLIGRSEGILVGISSGAAAYAAITLARRLENKGKNIVVLLPDAGDRYLSIPDLFE